MRNTYGIITADCLDMMRDGIATDSIDSIVTDPPYGLAEGSKGLKEVFVPLFFDVFLPQLNERVPSGIYDPDLFRPLGRVALLDFVNRTLWKDPRIGVPERAVNLDNNPPFGGEEIKDTQESSRLSSDRELMHKPGVEGVNEGGNFMLQLRHRVDAPLRDGATCGITECGFGRLRVSVVVPLNSEFMCFLRPPSPRLPGGRANNIRGRNDASSDAERDPFIVALSGTEMHAVLTFDLSGGTIEITPTGPAREDDTFFQVVPSEFVGALPGARDLPTVFETHQFRLVGDTANRTLSFSFHKFMVPFIQKKASGFMGKAWDHGVPGVPFWTEALRIAKPGAYLLAFGGTRTFHRLACAIEDAGWEIRDTIGWLYGSGFPKSHDVSKAIDREAGHWRGKAGEKVGGDPKRAMGQQYARTPKGDPVTAAAAGWGTALKPAWEPIIMARKPLIGTVAANVMQYGTGGINIDACRVGYTGPDDAAAAAAEIRSRQIVRNTDGWGMRDQQFQPGDYLAGPAGIGRWPANICHDGSDEVLAVFPTTGPSTQRAGKRAGKRAGTLGAFAGQDDAVMGHTDLGGSAARFFYCAKASKSDRNDGCDALNPKQYSHDGRETPIENAYQRNASAAPNHHPTVKPTDLMRWLVRLVTPPGGTVLDPFCGSGSTGRAALLEGFNFIGIERDPEYAEIARARCAAVVTP